MTLIPFYWKYLTTIFPNEDAAAEWTIALTFDCLTISKKATHVKGLTKLEAASLKERSSEIGTTEVA